MVKPAIKKIVYFTCQAARLVGILSSFYLMSCANQLPPGGGPLDTVPPKIVEVFPENGTTNFSE
ncbi:MAG: hypothetical protein WC557_02740, partial [Ignavibacteriaceae bacterium]